MLVSIKHNDNSLYEHYEKINKVIVNDIGAITTETKNSLISIVKQQDLLSQPSNKWHSVLARAYEAIKGAYEAIKKRLHHS